MPVRPGPPGGIHLSTGGAVDLAILTIERDSFLHWAADLGCPELAGPAFEGNWVAVAPDRQEGLRAYLRQLFAVALRDPARLAGPGWPRLVLEDLVPLLVEALAPLAGQATRSPLPVARIELVKAAQRWMEEHPTEPITLDALCRRVHAGRRSLIQGFREYQAWVRWPTSSGNGSMGPAGCCWRPTLRLPRCLGGR